MTDGELRAILFHCDDGDHLVSRGDAVRHDGQFVCPRHYQEHGPKQQTLVSDGGVEHGDRAFYCEHADRYLLSRDDDGCCPFCGTDLTGERYERAQRRAEGLGGSV